MSDSTRLDEAVRRHVFALRLLGLTPENFCRREGALWTSDIAYGVRLPTARVRAEMIRLERAGRVRRVVVGNPTSWALAEPSE